MREAGQGSVMLYGTTETEEFKNRARFVILFATSIFLVLAIIWVARIILLLLFAATLCALILTTAAEWTRAKLKLPRGLALAFVMTGGVGLVALGIWLRGSEIAEQFTRLQVDLPLAAHKLLTQLQTTEWGRWVIARFSDNAHHVEGFTFAMSRIGGIVLSGATSITGLVIVAVASFYFAAEPDSYLRGLRLIVPRSYRNSLERCITAATQQMRWWLLAKLVSMIAVGVLVSIGLWILGIPLWGTLGIITAGLTFIPNAGPILSAIPAGLLAFAISPTKGLLTILLYFGVHFIEGNFVTPLAERQIVKMPPGLTLVVQLFLASVTGALGIALAAPLTAAALGVVSGLLPEGVSSEHGIGRPRSSRSSV
jgi:predicted PurR-regulated permease PerM